MAIQAKPLVTLHLEPTGQVIVETIETFVDDFTGLEVGRGQTQRVPLAPHSSLEDQPEDIKLVARAWWTPERAPLPVEGGA